MGRPWRAQALRCSVAVLAIAVASGCGGGTHKITDFGALVGQWTRTVTGADVKRSGATGIPAGSVWTFTVKKGGAAHIAGSTGDAFDGTVVNAGANRIHIELGLSCPCAYRWSISGQQLTFTKTNDPVGDRVAVFWGVWQRK